MIAWQHVACLSPSSVNCEESGCEGGTVMILFLFLGSQSSYSLYSDQNIQYHTQSCCWREVFLVSLYAPAHVGLFFSDES